MKTRTRISYLVVVALAACALVAPAQALAEESPWQAIDSLLQPQPVEGGSLLLVSGQLRPGVDPPAEVWLPVPTGAKIVWAGEILGGSAESDPEVEYRIEKGDDYDKVVFTLKGSRIGQVEVDATSLVKADGKTLESTLPFTYEFDVPSARFGIRVAPGSEISDQSEGLVAQQGPDGYAYYATQPTPYKAGSKVEYSLTFIPGEAPAPTGGQPAPQPNATGGGGNGVSPFLFVGGALIVVALFLYVSYLGAARREQGADEDEDEAADEGEDVDADGGEDEGDEGFAPEDDEDEKGDEIAFEEADEDGDNEEVAPEASDDDDSPFDFGDEDEVPPPPR